MEKEETIRKYIINNELNIEEMIQDFNAYIQKVIENNARESLDREDKEEIVSDVFLTVWHNKEKIDRTRPLKYYMAGIAKNLIKNKLREKKKINKNIELKDIELQDLNDMELVCEERQILEVINQELNNMKIQDYKIFSKYYYSCKSIKEIAKELKMSETNVGVRLHRIKKKLRKKLLERGLTYKILSVILVLFLITGVVFAKQIVTFVKDIIAAEEEKPEKIGWGRCNISINADREKINNYMNKQDDNIYTLYIKDLPTFEKVKNELQIEKIKDDDIDSHTVDDRVFKENYEVLLIVFENSRKLTIANVLFYKSKVVVEYVFDEKDTEIKDKIAFCLLIPKTYHDKNVECSIMTTKEIQTRKPSDAINFSFTSIYIDKIEKFDNMNLNYNAEQELYYTEFLDMNEYNKLVEKLGIVSMREIGEDKLKNRDIILIFKKTNKKIKLNRFRITGEMPCIYLEETEEENGKEVNGLLFIVDKTGANKYEVSIE